MPARKHKNLFLNVRVQLILCKDNASEQHKNLFLNVRVQLILCKGNAFMPHAQIFPNVFLFPDNGCYVVRVDYLSTLQSHIHSIAK
ncbi:hypothetical protein CLI69_09995 [Prevotella intermedia]|nr:hypothetical protein CLI69_09995 [Prevotella intermedia]